MFGRVRRLSSIHSLFCNASRVFYGPQSMDNWWVVAIVNKQYVPVLEELSGSTGVVSFCSGQKTVQSVGPKDLVFFLYIYS